MTNAHACNQCRKTQCLRRNLKEISEQRLNISDCAILALLWLLVLFLYFILSIIIKWSAVSVRLSVVCRMEAHHTGNPWTYLEVKRSKVKFAKCKIIVAASCFYSLCTDIYIYIYVEGGYWNSHAQQPMLFQRGCSFTLPAIHSTQIEGITVSLCVLVKGSSLSCWSCRCCLRVECCCDSSTLS